MATYSMGDLKKGLKIEIDGIPYKIVEYQHVKPGKGAAFVRTKIKSFINGRVIEKTVSCRRQMPISRAREQNYAIPI